MNIIAISTVRDEADILPRTLAHLRAQGVDSFIISYGPCTDDTPAILAADPLVTAFPSIDPFDQADEMTRLCRLAYDAHADWVIPFDADEFWKPTPGYGDTLRICLASLDPEIDTVYAPMFTHLDWNQCAVHQKPLGKICFRPRETTRIEWGNHQVSPTTGDVHGIIQIRELQYRDRAHFDAKIARSTALHSEVAIPVGFGVHMQELIDGDDAYRDAIWLHHQSIETTWDPI